MATLYELTDEYKQLLDMLEDDTVDPELLKDTLEAVDGEIEVKADRSKMPRIQIVSGCIKACSKQSWTVF